MVSILSLKASGVVLGAIGLCAALCGCVIISDSTREVIVATDYGAWAEGPEAKAATIRLFGTIDAASAADVSVKLAILSERPGVQRIRLLIACDGGDASSYRVIVNALREARHPVDGMVVGNCYSAAAAVLQAVTGRRAAYANAHFMVHGVRVPETTDGGIDDLIRFETAEYVALVRSRARLPQDWFPLAADKLYFFTAEEALHYGFLDEVLVLPGPTASAPPALDG